MMNTHAHRLCFALSVTALFTLCFAVSGCRKEQEVVLEANFAYEVVDSNYNVPVTIRFTNTSRGAQFYKWSFSNGTPETYNERNPGAILFSKPGTITVKLEAWNDFERKEKTIQILLDTVPRARFNIAPRINNYAPVEWDAQFTGEGATTFNWDFAGGAPGNSADKNPTGILYNTPGTYKVKLQVKNNRGRIDTLSKTITVLPSLSAAFDIEPSFDDDDFEAPLTAKLANHTISATQHAWQAPGGTLSNSADSLPSVTFTNPGTYTITYNASNGKQQQTVTRSITVKPNTRLRSFSNLHLGINTAHATIGSFFSTRLRKVFVKDSVNAQNGSLIDVVFFGLSNSFSFNKFISPTDAANWTFPPIPGATVTAIINKQETCACGTNVTAAQFDNISNGSFFDGITVMPTLAGSAEFTNALANRVVVFQNAAGKKGAVKIKQYVDNGQQSYIVCDIKIQKD
jgi:PKD repeat protein